MDAGLLGSLIATAVVILGGGAKLEMGRISRRDKEIEVLKATVATQEQTIDRLERQNDRLQITADIQDKFFTTHLPPPKWRDDPGRPA